MSSEANARTVHRAASPEGSFAFRALLLAISLFLFAGPGQALSKFIDAMGRSANYLMESIQADGKFNYRINMNPNVKVKKKYNILRHAGTVYSLTMYHEIAPDANLQRAIEQTGRYLRDQALEPLPGRDDLLAIWSKPEVNGSGKPLQAKLGGSGLGLVALASIERANPGFTGLVKLRALARFIVFMQKDDGDFYSKFIPSLGGRQDEWRSLYYPGEAALGLVMLAELDPNARWQAAAGRALLFLADRRRHQSGTPADHWALLATERLLQVDHGLTKNEKARLIQHAVQICEAILGSQVEDPNRPKYSGGFTNDGRTTPTATRLEGLLASLSFLPVNHSIRPRIQASVTRGLQFLLRAQIVEGPFSGGMPRAVGLLQGSDPETRTFNRRATEIRIDYVQHALSAFIQCLHLKPGHRSSIAPEPDLSTLSFVSEATTKLAEGGRSWNFRGDRSFSA